MDYHRKLTFLLFYRVQPALPGSLDKQYTPYGNWRTNIRRNLFMGRYALLYCWRWDRCCYRKVFHFPLNICYELFSQLDFRQNRICIFYNSNQWSEYNRPLLKNLLYHLSSENICTTLLPHHFTLPIN